MFDYTPSLISFAGGLLIGWCGHALAVRRDRENRKRAFRAFLAQWRSKIENSSNTGGHFSEFIHAFRGECAKVRNDFRPRARFNELTGTLSALDRTQIEQGDQTLLPKHLDAILNFTDDA